MEFLRWTRKAAVDEGIVPGGGAALPDTQVSDRWRDRPHTVFDATFFSRVFSHRFEDYGEVHGHTIEIVWKFHGNMKYHVYIIYTFIHNVYIIYMIIYMYTSIFFKALSKNKLLTAWGRPRCHLSKDLRKWAGEHLSEAQQLGLNIRYVQQGGAITIVTIYCYQLINEVKWHGSYKWPNKWVDIGFHCFLFSTPKKWSYWPLLL